MVSSLINVDVHITEVTPLFGPSEGGTLLTIKGTGFYDSTGKKFKFESSLGEREMDAVWNRKEKCFTCKAPPKSWFIRNRGSSTGIMEDSSETRIKIRLTLNGQDWIWIGYFDHYDPIVERMSYDLDFGEGLTEEEKQAKLIKREEIPIPPENPEELKKYQAELEKKLEEDKELFESLYQRCGTIFYIHGRDFRDSNVNLSLTFRQ